MSWFRLDDQGAFHAKVVKAGNEAYGAWCRAGQWCSAHGSTGFIPIEVAHLLASKKIWDRALSCGLLDKTDGAGYQIHDFNEYNPTEEQVDARKARLSAARSAAGKTGGIKSGVARSGLPSGPSNGEANGEANAKQTRSKHEANTKQTTKQNDEANTKQNEAPSRPVPSPGREEPAPPFASMPITAELEFTDEAKAIAAELAITDAFAVWHKFIGMALDRGWTTKNVLGRWRQFCANERKYQAIDRAKQPAPDESAKSPARRIFNPQDHQ